MAALTWSNGNVGARQAKKRGREVCLWREFEDAGGVREFTLYLSVDEAERLFDALDDLLAAMVPDVPST